MRPGGDVGRPGEEGGRRGAVVGGGEVVPAQPAARPVGRPARDDFSGRKESDAGASDEAWRGRLLLTAAAQLGQPWVVRVTRRGGRLLSWRGL